MAEKRVPHINQHLYAAGVRAAHSPDEDQGLGSGTAATDRRQMLIGLQAADALDRAVAEGLVGVSFARLAHEDADALDMNLEIAIGATDHDLYEIHPNFRFNLRDAYQGYLGLGDRELVERVARVLPALEQLVEQMRADLRGTLHVVENATARTDH